MKKFQYQLVQYIHDRVTSEFVNVGIIVFQPESSFLKSKFISKFSRISMFFNEINGKFLLSSLRQFENEIIISSKRLGDLFSNFSSLSKITNSILPKDDSALVCSEIYFGIDIDPQSALDDLFDRIIAKYCHEAEKDIHDDKYVWKKIYKQYFDKYNLTDKLKPHTVITSNDQIEFDKAWKNGAWNCYQTLSFDLKRTDSIRNKVYKWSGILNELENLEEEHHLFFLTTAPTGNKATHNFIHEMLLKHNKNTLKVELVDEQEADQFALNLKDLIERHQE